VTALWPSEGPLLPMLFKAAALFHGSMSRSRAAATSAPAKFGMRPCGGNGKRASGKPVPNPLVFSAGVTRGSLIPEPSPIEWSAESFNIGGY
jgi:hypothetical protein